MQLHLFSLLALISSKREDKVKGAKQAKVESLRSLRKTLRQCHTLEIRIARNLYILKEVRQFFQQ